jgi:aspartokinase
VDTQGTGLPACGVTVAENLASLRLGGPAEELRTQLGQLGVGFRPCQGGPEAEASCVVSTAELPEWRSLRAALTRRLGSRLTFREGLSGLSVIGTGLPPGAAENALETARQSGVEVLGVETSPRRITLLVAGGQANRLTAALHRTFIESPDRPAEDLPG